ncbi:MAG: HPr(Ser) kinase/phosphatase [candidate division WOR-3 bacterium]|jgi:HPr kinase/phosphorylase|nr:HPr(Ser) kinase/phosphatase [candidate division WOR-3 bacterium]MDH7518235.1 HPr(Ser) kinase/phosphatase [bacterium]
MEISSKQITVGTLLEEKKADWQLELLAGSNGLETSFVTTSDINRPGMALAGYTGVFLRERIQIVGSTELSYLENLSSEQYARSVKTLLGLKPVAVIITKNLPVADVWIQEGNKTNVPIIRTPLDTTPFIHLLSVFLDYRLAPETYIHGDLVDVFGVGLLITGESGIGKSECALDLVDRGHRLVADDLVRVLRRGTGILMGYPAAKSPALAHHIEVRGVGIVDVYSLYGVRAIRIQKRVEVEVRLVPWQSGVECERAGLEEQFSEILGVKIPLVTIPVVPGKNLALVHEVIAKNHILKVFGYYPARRFNDELMRVMSKSPIDPYITEDQE